MKIAFQLVGIYQGENGTDSKGWVKVVLHGYILIAEHSSVRGRGFKGANMTPH